VHRDSVTYPDHFDKDPDSTATLELVRIRILTVLAIRYLRCGSARGGRLAGITFSVLVSLMYSTYAR
jgi:hypothetical protein